MIAADAPNTGSYFWMVSGPPTNGGSTALVAVVDQAGRVGSDASDHPFSIVDGATEALVTQLNAVALEGAVRLTWKLARSEEVFTIEPERAPAEVGPWAALELESRENAGVTTVEDRTVEPGRTYWYRLSTVTSAGERLVFGPVRADVQPPRAFEITRTWPNPSRGSLEVEFTTAELARVHLSLFDLAGREVHQFAESTYPAGRFRLEWNCRTGGDPVPAGVYFLIYRAGGHRVQRRVVITR